MLKEEYKRNYLVEEKQWWFAGMRQVYIGLLGKYFQDSKPEAAKILDIGCGTGGNFCFLKDKGKIFGIDRVMEPLNFCKRSGF